MLWSMTITDIILKLDERQQEHCICTENCCCILLHVYVIINDFLFCFVLNKKQTQNCHIFDPKMKNSNSTTTIGHTQVWIKGHYISISISRILMFSLLHYMKQN